MVIRAPNNKDWKTLTEITNHYITTGAAHLAYHPYKPGTLSAIYQMRDRHPWYVYEDDEGAILGYAKAGPFVDQREEAYQPTCGVDVYVAEHAHRRGIGRKLYDAVLSNCQHYRSAVARIALPNPAAIALHERCGFTRIGTLVEAVVKNKTWHDVDLWQKRLAAGPG